MKIKQPHAHGFFYGRLEQKQQCVITTIAAQSDRDMPLKVWA
jgi:hypothetical protein